MSIVSFIVTAIAFGIICLVTYSRCAAAVQPRLSAGLLTVIAITIAQLAMYLLGIAIGNILRLEAVGDNELYNTQNAYIALGLIIIVVIKTIAPYLKRKPQLPIFDLTHFAPAASMAIVMGLDIFLVGIAIGFVSPLQNNILKSIIPFVISTFTLGFIGIMFGRQKVKIRPKRWILVASLMLVVCAIAIVVNNS